MLKLPIRNDSSLVIIFCLMIIDYLLTKVGIFLGLIIEGNALMVWLMSLPFVIGFLVRVLMAVGLLAPIYLVYGVNRNLYKIAVLIAMLANLFAMLMHMLWIGYTVVLL